MKFFTEHPQSVGESYGQHFFVALSFAITLFGAASAALVHAFFPAWFEKTASQKITLLHERMVNKRKKVNANNDEHFEKEMAETAR